MGIIKKEGSCIFQNKVEISQDKCLFKSHNFSIKGELIKNMKRVVMLSMTLVFDGK